jgi:4-alpha-glucanotransferase
MSTPAAAFTAATPGGERKAGGHDGARPLTPLLQQRRAGVLLHPTALRGETEPLRGAIGSAARAFIDWMSAGGFSVWQVLPLGAPGVGGSPYWARSDMAGQPSLIDRDELPSLDSHRDDYEHFLIEQRDWLEDYVLFDLLSERFQAAWWDWPDPFRLRDADALARFAIGEREHLEQRRQEQWYFDWQWRALRRYAAERGVYLFGDLPIYVAPDSVSTWAHREQFQLDARGRPAMLAGVPPDYFSADGQLWGNPLYNWAQAERDHFQFWRTRLRHQLRRFDLVRIDHFRGLAAYWAVPAGAKTARDGRWYPSPGHALFQALLEECPDLPVIAEDLGLITPDVVELRHAFSLPGMRVLQFGFDGRGDNPHLPHNYTPDVVAYTGTHDNDTSLGWYRQLEVEDAHRVQFYLGSAPENVPEYLLRACLGSVARLAVIPLQDLLRLDSSARFNTPGTSSAANWSWRLPQGELTAALASHLRALNEAYGRWQSPTSTAGTAAASAAASAPSYLP